MLTYYKKMLLFLVFTMFFGTVGPGSVYGDDTVYIKNAVYSGVHTGGITSSGNAGTDGEDGRQGKDGTSGQDGADGITISSDTSSSVEQHVIHTDSSAETTIVDMSSTSIEQSVDSDAARSDLDDRDQITLRSLLSALHKILVQYVLSLT